MRKIRRFALLGLVAGFLAAAQRPDHPATVTVSGRITVLDKGDKPAGDVGQSVIWLTGSRAPVATPDTVEMATEGKQFVPRLVVIPQGSLISYPNHDPFNHNVFSLSPEGRFDLGLYGRGEARSAVFNRPGVIRVYCNVHAQMRGVVLVLPSPLVAQPGADGSFKLDGVLPGDYILHVWHERAAEVTQPLRVPAANPEPIAITLDARGYRLSQHRDKEGRSYSDRSRRY